jgi:hypothetical protein
MTTSLDFDLPNFAPHAKDEVRLRECPFCGNPALADFDYDGDEPAYYATCSNKQCPVHEIGMSFDKWNTRTPSPLLEQMAEALRGVSIMLNTELEKYEEEPWAQRVRTALTSYEEAKGK